MRKTQQSLVAIGLALGAALLCTGCLALMVPGLAYSGYKYEHDKNQPAASASSSNTQGTTNTSQQKIPDSSIE